VPGNEALAADCPCVLDAITDPDVPPLPPHITLEQAKALSSALLSGDEHADRIVRQSFKQKAQEFLPGRLGVSAGITIGLSIGLGGVGAPLLGLLADAHGLRAVFEVIAALPVLGLLLTLALPRGHIRHLRAGTSSDGRPAAVAARRDPV